MCPNTSGTFPELTESELEQKVREHLSQWWGPGEVQKWQHLRTYRIPFAQPNQVSAVNPELEATPGSRVMYAKRYMRLHQAKTLFRWGERPAMLPCYTVYTGLRAFVWSSNFIVPHSCNVCCRMKKDAHALIPCSFANAHCFYMSCCTFGFPKKKIEMFPFWSFP